jgi:hypothetical protein
MEDGRMDLPAGLLSTPLDSPTDGAAAAPTGMVALDVHVQHQAQDNWCWAAVASTVSTFLAKSSPWSQCAIASAMFPGAQCCEEGSSSACNQRCDLDDALEKTANLKSPAVNDQVEIADLISELKAGRPVCIRIEWDSGSGHFAMIRGASTDGSGAGHVMISDPIYKESYHDIGDLNGNYLNGDGRWTDTYYTRA